MKDDETRPAPARDIAVDALRGIALLGIMVNHVFGTATESLVWWDFHAIGFALLIGAGAGLGVPGKGSPWAVRRVAVLRNILRALVLVAIGFTLENLPNGGVAVILVRLAVIVMLVSLIALLPTVLLPVVAAAIVAAMPLLAWRLQHDDPGLFSRAVGWGSVGNQGAWLRMLLSPYHPSLLWLGVAVIGLWVMRTFSLRRAAHLGAIAGIGLLLSGGALGYVWWASGRWGRPDGVTLTLLAGGDFPTLFRDERWLNEVGAYLPSTPSLLFSAGVVLLAMALVGALCLVNCVALALRPLAIVGAMTLTGYTVHVLVEGQLARLTAEGTLQLVGWSNLGLQVAFLFTLLLAWSRLPGQLGKGPLEWLSRMVARLAGTPQR